jgi:hypothetical protein
MAEHDSLPISADVEVIAMSELASESMSQRPREALDERSEEKR